MDLTPKTEFLFYIKSLLACSVLLSMMCSFAFGASDGANGPSRSDPKLQSILEYISASWTTLTRSMSQCEALTDPKLTEATILYLPADMPVPAVLQQLSRTCKVRVEHLPSVIHGPGEVTANGIQPPGLLYLENPYVVPGGRFNEMYGWDSYFMIRGMISGGKI